MRAELLKKFGFWNEDFYLYHEDSEYSLRLKIRGYKIGLAGQADFYHIYNFSNKPRKLFWIERNRHALKLIFYKWPTLVLLLPAEILYNLGLMILSAAGGWFTELINVYKYWFKPVNWRGWLARRKVAQQERVISDRKILSGTTPMISFGEMKIPAMFRACANIVFTIYYFLLRILIWW
jgi:GT2 family glycosyltransferase